MKKKGDLDSFIEGHPNDEAALKNWEKEELNLLNERQKADDIHRSRMQEIINSHDEAEKLIRSGATVYTKISDKALAEIVDYDNKYRSASNKKAGETILKIVGSVSIGALGAVGLFALTNALSR